MYTYIIKYQVNRRPIHVGLDRFWRPDIRNRRKERVKLDGLVISGHNETVVATVRGRNVMKKKQYTTLASPPNLKLNDSLSKHKKIVNKNKYW